MPIEANRLFLMRRWLVATLIAVALSLVSTGSAAALAAKETKCQNAIAKAGHVLIVKSLLA